MRLPPISQSLVHNIRRVLLPRLKYNSIGTHPIFRSILFLVFLSGAARAFFQVFFPSRPQTPHYQEAFTFLLRNAGTQFLFEVYRTAAAVYSPFVCHCEKGLLQERHLHCRLHERVHSNRDSLRLSQPSLPVPDFALCIGQLPTSIYHDPQCMNDSDFPTICLYGTFYGMGLFTGRC